MPNFQEERPFIEIIPNSARQAVYAIIDGFDNLVCVLENCESADEMLAKNSGKGWTYILTELLSEAPKDPRSGFRRDVFCRQHKKLEPYNIIRPEDEEENECPFCGHNAFKDVFDRVDELKEETKGWTKDDEGLFHRLSQAAKAHEMKNPDSTFYVLNITNMVKKQDQQKKQ